MSEPRLGIFWIIDDEIISFSVTLDRAEHVCGFASYEHGHVHLWAFVQRAHRSVRGLNYDEVPRGRVTHVQSKDSFHLLLPPDLIRKQRLIRRLIQHFQLPVEKVHVLGDEHYDETTRRPEENDEH